MEEREGCELRRGTSRDNDAIDSEKAESGFGEGNQLPCEDDNALREKSTCNVSRDTHLETSDGDNLPVQKLSPRTDARGENSGGQQTSDSTNNGGKVREGGDTVKTSYSQLKGKNTATNPELSVQNLKSTVGIALPMATRSSVSEEPHRQRSIVSTKAVKRHCSVESVVNDVVDGPLDKMAWREVGPKGKIEDNHVLGQMDAHEKSATNSAKHRGHLHARRAKVWYCAIRMSTDVNPCALIDRFLKKIIDPRQLDHLRMSVFPRAFILRYPTFCVRHPIFEQT